MIKEEAISLWFKFVESNRVKKKAIDYGPGGAYSQYILQLELYGKPISEITLITVTLYSDPQFYREVKESSCCKKLYTPFGNFELTPDEANRLRKSWHERDKTKGELNMDELLKLL